MRTRQIQCREHATLQASSHTGRKRGGSLLKSMFLNGAIALLLTSFSHAGTFLALSTAAGGATITQQSAKKYRSSFGTVNALGVGSPTQSGVNINAQSNGALYYTLVSATVASAAGNAYVTGYASTDFTHNAAEVLYVCPNNATCGGGSNYSALSTNSGAQTQIVPSPGVASGSTVTFGVAVWVPDNDGATAYTGTDTATISFTVFNTTGNVNLETDTLAFNLPNETVDTAVSLNLASVAGGLGISPGADFSIDFSTVNGLGINPVSGLAVSSVAGGVIYSTPYSYTPAFSDINSSTATVDVYVSKTFTHSAILQLNDATASAGPFITISTSSTAQTQITNAAADRSSTTRYLGLFVSNANGAGSFTGTETATLTYTLTVP